MGIICKNGISYGGGSGGGGILPHLIIISETGESVVKAVKGTTEIIATETSTGHYECDVPEFGTWTIHAVLNGEDATVNLVVDTVKVYTVDDSHFHADITVKYPSGATCNLSGQGESYYATGSPYTFTVHHAGQYTITVVYDGQTYTETVTVTITGETFSKVVPSPSSAPANDIDWWLFFGDVSGSYSSLSDILADSTALATLMSSTDAVDYLVRCTDWTGKGLVPTMTSNTTPSGECFGSGISQRAAVSNKGDYWKIFNENEGGAGGVADDCAYLDHPLTGAYFGYDFGRDVNIVRAKIKTHTSQDASQVVEIQGYSSTLDTWVTIKTITSSGTINFDGTFTNANKYSKYRVYLSSTGQTGDYSWIIGHCQFYSESIPDNQSAMSYIGLNNYCANTLLADADWLDGIANSEYIDSVLNVKVPTMTSDTTPSGECFASSVYSTTYPAWKAFTNQVDASGWNCAQSEYGQTDTAYVGYEFSNKKKIYVSKFTIRTDGTISSTEIRVVANDASNESWNVVSEVYSETNLSDIIICNSNLSEYKRFALKGSFIKDNTRYLQFKYIQFYGRADV